jgi:hypothetical protein
MPVPLRLRILKNLTVSLETVVHEYTPEVGKARPAVPMTGKVFRGRTVFGESDPLPMFSILEAPIPVDQIPTEGDNTGSKGRWELLVQGFVEEDHLHPTDPAHYLLAECKARLAWEKARNSDFNILGLGKHVLDIEIGPGVVRPPDEISAKAYFWLNVSLTLAEDLLKPYEIRTKG